MARLCMLALGCTMLALAIPAGPVQAQLPQRIEWKRVPIQLELKTGVERLVRFPGPVRVGIPDALRPLLRIQSLEGTVYFLAHAPFGPSRIVVHATGDRQVFLLDVSALERLDPPPPLEVYVRAPVPESVAGGATGRQASARYGYVTLTRFAALQLYAPARLAAGRPGIVRVPVLREPVALMHGGAVHAVPLVAWRAGSLYVTAVRLTNLSARARELDPRHLRGTWLAATFQHNRLLPAGSDADTTAVYLVSARPFEASRPGHGGAQK